MPFALLVVAVLVGLALIPLGLPGLWLMVAAAIAHHFLVVGSTLDWPPIAVIGTLALLAEVAELWLSARYTRKYGGSRRAGWGALLGGFVGAIVGVPVPIIGSVIGGFVGSFVGALLGEYSVSRHAPTAHRAAIGSVLGRVASMVAKTGVGFAIGAVLLFRAWGSG